MSGFVIENGVLKRYTGPGGAVTVPEDVTEIGRRAFSDCSGITSIVLPAGLTVIGARAFEYCIGLRSIVLPDGLTTLENAAFTGCRGLERAVLPKQLTALAPYVFNDCSGLSDITLPSTLTRIGESACMGCRGLTRIVLPEGLSMIGWRAFSNCSGLTGLRLPGSVKKIEGHAFQGCDAITHVTVTGRPSTELLRQITAEMVGLNTICVEDPAHAAALIRETSEDERLCGALAAGVLALADEVPGLLRTPELLREPVFTVLLRHAQAQRPEKAAELLQARHEGGPAEEDELEL